MAVAGLLALLDDIALLLDDVALMTKVAAKKTAGVLGDDLALNAEQVSGVRAERELPVVWAVFLGSLRNKLLLVPAAMAISTWLPGLIVPLLMVGGAYLCLEGAEKLLQRLSPAAPGAALRVTELADPQRDLQHFEREKIRGAVRTDFVLSAEIIVIALGSVNAASLLEQTLVLSSIALLMTVGVYGLVALIVKLDDIGLYLLREPHIGAPRRLLGKLLLSACPYLMRFLTVAGTLAMFLVGGSILGHSLPPALSHSLLDALAAPGSGGALLLGALFDMLLGVLAGLLLAALQHGWHQLRQFAASK